jgi:peptide/nickel transport system permease protein
MDARVAFAAGAPAEAIAGAGAWPAEHGLRAGLRRLARNRLSLVGLVVLAVYAVGALLAPWISPYPPLATDAGATLRAPGLAHLLGTDQFGRDILSRVLHAARLDLFIALTAVGAAVLLGGLLGSLAGYFGGWVDTLVMRATDALMAFPLFILAMGIVAALGNSVANIIYATAAINTPFYTRMLRAEMRVKRQQEFVDAARCSGNSTTRIIVYHLLPNCVSPLVVQITLNLGWAILNAAGLSFIGLGVRPPDAEWGIMVSEGARFMVSGEWWVSFFPGLALMLAVLGFNLLGDGLRDILDPRRP